MTFFVFDLLALANWRNAFSPDHAGSLAASFGPAANGRNVILGLEASSPLAAAGAKVGDQLSFNRHGDVLRALGRDETVGVTLYTTTGDRALSLQPVQDRNVARQPGAYAAGFFSSCVCALFSLALALMIAMRRPDSAPMRALAIGLLVDSIDFFSAFLPGSVLQDVLACYVHPLLVAICIISYLYFSLNYPEERPLFRLRGFRIAFWIIALTKVSGAIAQLIESFGGLSPAEAIFVEQARYVLNMACYVLTISALYRSWRASTGDTRHRLAWIAACLGIPFLTYFFSNAISLLALLSDRYVDIYGSIATAIAYVGLGYALLRHHLFNFSFAVNRTLVFTVTSLLMFLMFWLIEQVVHKLVHFEAVENNAVLGAVIAFALFFAFNRLHHRVDHWIEHLFFRQWRAKESELRTFVSKAPNYMDGSSMIAAFGVAIDRFNDRAGNAIYLAGANGRFECVFASLSDAPTVLEIDDDIAVSLRTSRQSLALTEVSSSFRAHPALPMLSGRELKGIILLGAKVEAQGYRPDEQAVLEFAAARISLDLNRLQAARLAEQLQQAQRAQELQLQEQLRMQQELDSVKQERATLILALSKVGTVA